MVAERRDRDVNWYWCATRDWGGWEIGPTRLPPGEYDQFYVCRTFTEAKNELLESTMMYIRLLQDDAAGIRSLRRTDVGQKPLLEETDLDAARNSLKGEDDG